MVKMMDRVNKAPAKARRYHQAWATLKQFKIVAMQPTYSKDPAIFSKWVKTIRKGVQKEKYYDDNFRARYPDAVISSHIDPRDPTKLVFQLDLGFSNAILTDLGD